MRNVQSNSLVLSSASDGVSPTSVLASNLLGGVAPSGHSTAAVGGVGAADDDDFSAEPQPDAVMIARAINTSRFKFRIGR